MRFKKLLHKSSGSQLQNNDFWFPGRWIGGVSLVLAPVLFLTGMLLRMQFHFFFPQQLEAYRDHPLLMTTAYNFFLVGNILLWPAILTVVRLIGMKRNQLALWAGAFVMFGLFARTFHGGINHLAFQLVRFQGLDSATKTIADSYRAFSIISTLNGTLLIGWLLLAVGCYLADTLNLVRSISLGMMSGLMIGVLKGTSLFSIVAAVGLCVALVPLGIDILKDGTKPRLKIVIGWVTLISLLLALLYFSGQAG